MPAQRLEQAARVPRQGVIQRQQAGIAAGPPHAAALPLLAQPPGCNRCLHMPLRSACQQDGHGL